MRTPIIAGNWKMNLTVSESNTLAENIIEILLKADSDASTPSIPNCEVVIAPHTLAVASVQETVRRGLQQKTAVNNKPSLHVAAQDVHYEDNGAFTGKISVSMLANIGLRYTLVGHSEQRQYFHETDEQVNKKIKKLLQANIQPIFCIGETLSEREAGNLETVLLRQLKIGLQDIELEDLQKVVIAYEPVWAIGTGVSATSKEAETAHQFVRTTLRELTTPDLAEKIRILYGGSVKASNAQELLHQPNIDGALVGGASLQAESFTKIIFSLA